MADKLVESGQAQEPVGFLEDVEEAEERAYGRPWLIIWPPQVHRTYRCRRHGPYRGLVQTLVEMGGTERGRRGRK